MNSPVQMLLCGQSALGFTWLQWVQRYGRSGHHHLAAYPVCDEKDQRTAWCKNPINSPSFKEFVVNFDKTGKSVAEINKKLLEHKILGGRDLSEEFPNLVSQHNIV